MRTDLPFIVHEFKVYVRNMSDRELHQEIVGQWNTTKDFDEDEMNILIEELDRRTLAHKALDRMVAENQRLGLYDDAVNISAERVDETAKDKHEPVGWLDSEGRFSYFKHLDSDEPLYTAPPKREWIGLTDEEIIACFDSVAFGQVEDDLIINKRVNIFTAIRGIEAKLKEKNT